MIANIALNDAMILPYDANPGRMEFSERTGTAQPASRVSSVNCGRVLEMPAIPRVSRPIEVVVLNFAGDFPLELGEGEQQPKESQRNVIVATSLDPLLG
jgi:hypothetical protein